MSEVQSTLEDLRKIEANIKHDIEGDLNELFESISKEDHGSSTIDKSISENGSQTITIPTTEFCSLNMRLLERNNEVRLALEAASKANEKLQEYRKTSEQSLKQIQKQWSDYRKEVQNEMKKMKNKVNNSSQESSEAQNMVLENQLTIKTKDEQISKLKHENTVLIEKIKEFSESVKKNQKDNEIKTQKYLSIKDKEIETLQIQLKQALSDQHLLKTQIETVHKLDMKHSQKLEKKLLKTNIIYQQLYGNVKIFRNNFNNNSNFIKENLSIMSNNLFVIDKNEMKEKSKRFSRRMAKEYSGKVGYIVEQYKNEKLLRKKYYNLLQELRGNIQVFCRVRPVLSHEKSQGYKNCVSIGTHISEIEKNFMENGGMNINTSSNNSSENGMNNNNNNNNNNSNDSDSDDEMITIFDIERNISLSFTFDKIFSPKSSQKDVFDYVSPMIQSVLDGYNVCIFAYGQTGSGKTHTMAGPSNDPGVNVQALTLLFEKMNHDKDISYKISISLLEIYNENIIDLLSSHNNNDNNNIKQVFGNASPSNRFSNNNNRPYSAKLINVKNHSKPIARETKLKPRENNDGTIIVPGLTIVEMTDVDQIFEYLEMGHANRHSGVTDMNEHSSRSHLVLTVYIKATNTISKQYTLSKLHLIDLAGSERNKKSHAKGNALKEAIAINSSLSALGDVIAARSAKTNHVPYRRSILTYLLKDSLEKDCKTVMITQISPLDRDTSESSCSLKFANRVKTVELGKAKKQTFKLDS